VRSSEAKNNSRGYARVVLRCAKEAGLHVIALETPGYRTNDFVIEASAQSGAQRRVGADAIVHVDVRYPHQKLGKGNLPTENEARGPNKTLCSAISALTFVQVTTPKLFTQPMGKLCEP